MVKSIRHGASLDSVRVRLSKFGPAQETDVVRGLYPHRFSRPELQISLQNTFSQTTNALTIVISKEEYEQINTQAEESRAKVREMFTAYRPGALNNGNGVCLREPAISSAVQEKFANYRPGSGNGK